MNSSPQGSPAAKALEERYAGRTGYEHTLREILQQPETWRATAEHVAGALEGLAVLVDGVRAFILTGSGSSEYAGDCARPAFQRRLGVTTQAIGSGALLTDGVSVVPADRPALMIHFARSGDSPESGGALRAVLAEDAAVRQLAVTCNANGMLAQRAKTDDRVHALVLDARTNDRSLVMTSSFTNMVLAAQGLTFVAEPQAYRDLGEELARASEAVLQQAFHQFAEIGSAPFSRVFYLASPANFGAAREAALKMTEMTAGRVVSVAETFLGVRHGPMSAIHPETLLVCFLSSDDLVRPYEEDLVRELNAKNLGMAKILVGSRIPRDLVRKGDLVIEDDGFAQVTDTHSAVLHVVAGQVLALYRCMQEGLRPDAPSESGVINRVVQAFQLHGSAVDAK